MTKVAQSWNITSLLSLATAATGLDALRIIDRIRVDWRAKSYSGFRFIMGPAAFRLDVSASTTNEIYKGHRIAFYWGLNQIFGKADGMSQEKAMDWLPIRQRSSPKRSEIIYGRFDSLITLLTACHEVFQRSDQVLTKMKFDYLGNLTPGTECKSVRPEGCWAPRWGSSKTTPLPICPLRCCR